MDAFTICELIERRVSQYWQLQVMPTAVQPI